MSGEKARYRVLRLSHIHNNLWPEGSEVEYEGEPGTALEPLNDAAKLAKEIAEKRKGKSAASVVNSPVSVAVHPVVEELKSDGTGAVSEDLTQLRQQYEDLLGKKPGNKTAETLAKEIAEKRKGKSAASVVNSPVSVAVHPVVEELKSDGTGAVSEDLTQLRQQYEDLLGKKPGNKTAETLAKEIAEKRAELGI